MAVTTDHTDMTGQPRRREHQLGRILALALAVEALVASYLYLSFRALIL